MPVKGILALVSAGVLLGSCLSILENVQRKSPFAKHSVVPPQKVHQGRWLPGKPNSPLRVHLESPEGLAFFPEEVTRIEAKIQFTVHLEAPLKFQWDLPEDVELVEGESSGVIPPLPPGEIVQISISVRGIGYKAEPRNIQLNLATVMKGQRIGAHGLYASHPMTPDGSFRPRVEKARSGNWLFGKAAAEDDTPVARPPRGLHF